MTWSTTVPQHELPIPKLCREVLIGIEGLEKWDENGSDDYLPFFSHLLEDLQSTVSIQGESQPLIDSLDIKEKEELLGEVKSLDEFAMKLLELDVNERTTKFSEEKIENYIEQAETIYQRLNTLTKSQIPVS